VAGINRRLIEKNALIFYEGDEIQKYALDGFLNKLVSDIKRREEQNKES
jgi:hypothetical protein